MSQKLCVQVLTSALFSLHSTRLYMHIFDIQFQTIQSSGAEMKWSPSLTEFVLSLLK